VTVSSKAAYNIENRIIGARQHMNSMMSDMARNMYLNYKPPVTAFRMNLNPGNLGSIAVLIKNDKESGLSISLNMSNVATLDSFVDNQAALRAALAKNFNTNTNINLEFNMQDGGQQQGNNGQHNKKQQQNHQATNDILESLNNNSESNNKITNYM
ncbi:MAG: flagellar hook-length control protein FliK, partial [Arcobacteraceae bacterium]|nr:flagellar hook-length control protein FliK [Arcobacteraceae bacterium]